MKIYLILLLALLFGETSCTESGKRNSDNLYAVKRIVDGDTFYIDDGTEKGSSVRLIGVDTPETKHPRKEVEYYGKEASDYLKTLLAGKTVRLEFDVQERDRYGRLLAYVYVGKTFVNADLVKNGYAQIATYPPNVKYVELFQKLETEARENNRGLWGKDS